jgi:hypothetical protein
MSDENKKRLGIAATIIGVFILLWLLIRRGQMGVATVTNVPATSQSGLPQYSPQNDVFNLQPPVLAPSPGLTSLPASVSDPTLNFAGSGPVDLTYNFPPLGFMPTPAPASDSSCGCGSKSCCGGCDAANNSTYPDGNGGTCLAADPAAPFKDPIPIVGYGAAA